MSIAQEIAAMTRAAPKKRAGVTRAASPRKLLAARREAKKGGRPAAKAERRISHLHKPPEMDLDQWQRELRRQFGREQPFELENLGDEPVFSEFRVTNPARGSAYAVTIRGSEPGDNHCACADFATSRLGTCKHIEFALAKLGATRSGKAALEAEFVPEYSELVLQYGAKREVRFWPGSQCPPEIRELAREFFATDGGLLPEAFGKIERFLSAAGQAGHEVRCREDTLAYIAEVRDGEERRRRIDAAFEGGAGSTAFADLLKAKLYDYQKEGALFAARAGRCLIGDDMGLGKTIQAIAAAEILARHMGVSRVLVICPTSLKHQWEREIAAFTERRALVIQGLRAKREQLFGEECFFKITNYDTVHRDLDLIAGWGPDMVILDEAQRIKNWNTRAARSVKRIVTPYAAVLTGTPLENRLQELVSIVEFVDRHRLGPTHTFLANHQTLDEFGKVVGYRELDAIGRTLAPILIRRRKSEVLQQLPGRLDKHFFVPMTPEQMRHHEENREIVARIVSKWRHYKYLSEADQRRLTIALQNMRMSCNSTYLLDQTTDHGSKADELLALLEEIFERPGEKVVVFSQWQRTHELIARRLKARGYGYVQFNGSVPGPKRRELIDRFREDPDCRAFLSTDAGGVGLNLQHAAVVVNMDLPWNPAVLEQRIGRVHRLGQKSVVRVVNFVAQGTIEEGMLGLLKFKKSLFEGALDGGANEVFLGGSRLTRFMETVDKATAAIPEEQCEEPVQAEAAVPAGEEEEDGMAPVKVEPGMGAAETQAGADAGPQPRGRDGGENAPAPPGDRWGGLIQAGMTLLQQLATAARAQEGAAAGVSGSAKAAGGLVRRDERTGESYLHVPMPAPELLERMLGAAQEWLRGAGG